MTQPFSAPGTRTAGIPAIDAPQHQLASFPTYAGAERLVDTLSDKGFPVEHVRIVGNGLRSVEYVTGRLTNGRAALAGAASGAWLGLLFGVLLSVFSDDSGTFGVVLSSVVAGAVWFAALGYAAHVATRGRRDFTSVQGLEAEQYVVSVTADRADEAIRLAGLL